MRGLFLIFLLNFFVYAQDSMEQSPAQSSTQKGEFLDEFENEYHQQTPIKDPLIRYNRWMHNVNSGIYDYAISPALNVYNRAMPLGYRIGIYNFFDNLAFPLRFLASLLAGEPKNAMDEMGRFAINSTAGILGIFDIASQNGLYSHRNDFGITFGKWGIGSEFYFVLPLLGPSNLRDTLAMPLNALANPANYLQPSELAIGAWVLETTNYTARHKETLDSLYQDSLDSYLLFRDAYEQRRNELILDK